MDRDALLTHILDSNIPSTLLGGAPPVSVMNNKFTSPLTAAAAEETHSTVDTDIQAAVSCNPRRPVVLVGPEGSGKTTSLVKLVVAWARGEHLQNFSYVFHFNFRDLNVLKGALSLEVLLLQHHGHVPPESRAQILQNPEAVLFVFDDMDQWNHSLDPSVLCSDPSQVAPVSRLVASLLHGSLLKGAAFILASRIDIGSEFLRVEVLGFLKPQREDYCKGFFAEGKNGETAWTHMERTLGFYKVCSSPRFCWTVCNVYKSLMDAGAALPETLTQLYVAVLVHLVQTLNQNPVYNRDLVSALGKMATRCSLEKRSDCTREELDSLGLQPFLSSVGVFLRIHGDQESGVFSFHSQLMQDFILAVSFFLDTSRDTSTSDGVEKMLENHKSEFLGLFLSGLSEPPQRRPLEVQLGDLDSDRVAGFRRWFKSSSEAALQNYDKLKHYRCFRLLHQTQNQSLVREVVGPSANIGIGYKDPSPQDCAALSYVITCLGKTEQLNLYSTNMLWEQQAEMLVPAMSLSQKIILDNCMLATGAVRHLASALSRGLTEDLDLRRSHLGDDKFRVLCSGLGGCKLHTLNLQQCDLSEEACGDLVSVLTSGSSQLRVLDMRHNDICDPGFTKLCQALQSPLCRLEELWLHGCKLSITSMEALAASLCSGQSALRMVELRENPIGVEGVAALCRGLQHPLCRLRVLNFYCTELPAATWPPLMEALMLSHCSLSELELSGNDVGQEEALLLCQALRRPGCPMEKLGLEGCKLTEPFFREMSLVLMSGSSRLKSLSVGINVKGDDAVKPLWEAVAHPNCVLEELDVQMSDLTDACVPDVCAAIRASQTLKILELRINLLTDVSVPALVRVVQDSSSMQELNLKYNDISEDVFELMDECEKIVY